MWKLPSFRKSAGPTPIAAISAGQQDSANRRGKVWWIVLSGMLVIAGLTVATALMIANLRERALANGARELEETVLLLARHFDQQFDDYADAQGALSARLQIDSVATPAAFGERLSGKVVHQILEEEALASVNSGVISLFDSDGAMVNTSTPGLIPAVNVSGRGYFKAFKSNATAATTLTETALSLVNAKVVTIIARRLTNSNGVFLGVLTRRLDPLKFERFFESATAGGNGAITMAQRSGELIARYPRSDKILMGDNLGASFRNFVAASDHGTLQGTSPIDGHERLAATRLMRDFPIALVATKTTDAVLADWREQTRLLIGVAGLLTVVIVVVFLLIGWRQSAERKVTERHLALGKAQLKTALTNMSQGLCLFDADRKLVISNPRFCEIYGIEESEVYPGLPFDQFMQDRLALGDKIDAQISDGTNSDSKTLKYIARLWNGRIVLVRRTPTPDGGWVATQEDISERERANTALAERLEELTRARNRLEAQKGELIATSEALGIARDVAEAASRSKSDFLAMMSHEIRTPMAGMMGMIDLLNGTSLDAEQTELANVAQESARNLLVVVNNILDFSKLEAGQLEPESIGFNVGHAIKGVAMLLGPRARAQGLAFETSLSDTMPAWLNGDPSRIGQILLNLVGNALKFTKQGSVRIEASHRQVANGIVELRIDVIDTGAGIPLDVQASLFNPFVQADTSVSRKYGGTGLGLAICRKLCATMGGAIEVESEPGAGSRFWFTVRCSPGRAPELVAPPLQPAQRAESEACDILVAEDNEILRSLISKLLARAGHRATMVCNGEEAVAAVQAHGYDLVLMDMQMPVMDGISATEAIRGLSGPERNVPIIALTANALVGQREICVLAGMNDFLTKPIQPALLIAAIQRWAPAASDRAIA